MDAKFRTARHVRFLFEFSTNRIFDVQSFVERDSAGIFYSSSTTAHLTLNTEPGKSKKEERENYIQKSYTYFMNFFKKKI